MRGERFTKTTLPTETSEYHTRQAAHFRALVAHATTARLKARLLEEAELHDRLATPTAEPDFRRR
jgi:hypothetical protein